MYRDPRILVAIMGSLLCSGLSTTLNNALIPYLQGSVGLNYSEVMCLQFCFFIAYFTLCPLSSLRMRHWGFLRGLCIAQAIGGVSCLILYAVLTLQLVFPVFLVMFLLGAGVAILQVAANPLILLLGKKETAGARMTFIQGFASLGMLAAPMVGSLFLDHRGERFPQVYLYVAFGWTVAATGVVILRKISPLKSLGPDEPMNLRTAIALFSESFRLRASFAALFIYVGIEVTIASFLASYLQQPSVLGMNLEQSAALCSLYWAGLLLGRFAGAPFISRFSPITLLYGSTILGVVLLMSAQLGGITGAISVILAGLACSIIYPTIFALALEGQERRATQLTGLLCMASCGGAVWPVLQGIIADGPTVQLSYLFPAVSFVGIALYARLIQRLSNATTRMAI